MAEVTMRKPDVTYYKKAVTVQQERESENNETAEMTAALSSPNTNTQPGGYIMLMVHVQNIGGTVLNGIEISDKLTESGLEYVENSALYYTDGQKPSAIEPKQGSDVVFNIPIALSQGRSIYLSFLTKTKQLNTDTNSLYNYALVSSSAPCISTATNSLRFTAQYALLTAEKTAEMCSKGCRKSTVFIITLNNIGNMPACGIKVSDVLNEDFSLSRILYNGTELVPGRDFTIDKDNSVKISLSGCIAPGDQAIINIEGTYI